MTEFRPSDLITSTNKYFSIKKVSDQICIPFRDPAPIEEDGFTISTGGFRWGVNGNVCEVSFKNNKFEITRETILDTKMNNFDEIERCTFWNEFMFFSARAKGSKKINKIQVAKLNLQGDYSYFGEIENSENLYVPCVDSKLRLLYHYAKHSVINKPYKQNLFFENNYWVLKKNINLNVTKNIIKNKISTKIFSIIKSF